MAKNASDFFSKWKKPFTESRPLRNPVHKKGHAAHAPQVLGSRCLFQEEHLLLNGFAICFQSVDVDPGSQIACVEGDRVQPG